MSATLGTTPIDRLLSKLDRVKRTGPNTCPGFIAGEEGGCNVE